MKFSDRVYCRKLNFFFVGREDTHVMEVWCGLLKGERNLLVDCGTFYNWPDVEQLCAQAELALSDVHAIVHTHNHADHAGADAQLRKMVPDVEIWCHEAGRAWLEDKALQFSVRPIAYFNFLMSGSVDVNRTFKDGDVIWDTGYPIEILHTPGHSEDSASFFLPEESLLITGDAIPNLRFLPFYEDVDKTLASIEKCAAKKPKFVLSGFNGLWDMEKDGDFFALAAQRVRLVHETVEKAGDKEAAAMAVIRALGLKAQPNGLFYASIDAHLRKLALDKGANLT